MTGTSFSDACDFLYPRVKSGREYSLDPTKELLNFLGNPEKEFPTIHIGGTNGKGSVGAMVSSALTRSGFKTGWYSSPHLVDVRERFRIGSVPISEDAFLAWFDRLKPAIEEIDATFFEATTALALAHFAASGVDIAVVEVGLGGRLDSTNVLSPILSAVTNIGLDHMEYLGDTKNEIAKEKAGIAKPDTPFVIGEIDRDVAGVLADIAVEVGAFPTILDPDGVFEGPLALRGKFQKRNAFVAKSILEALPKKFRPDAPSIADGLSKAWLPGRWDRRGNTIFDVAHNPEGMEVVAEALIAEPPKRPIHVLLGVLSDKDLKGILRRLAPVVDKIWITIPPTAPLERRLNLEMLANNDIADASVMPDFEEAFSGANAGAGTLLITGSFHTVGDAMARLPGFQPLG